MFAFKLFKLLSKHFFFKAFYFHQLSSFNLLTIISTDCAREILLVILHSWFLVILSWPVGLTGSCSFDIVLYKYLLSKIPPYELSLFLCTIISRSVVVFSPFFRLFSNDLPNMNCCSHSYTDNYPALFYIIQHETNTAGIIKLKAGCCRAINLSTLLLFLEEEGSVCP